MKLRINASGSIEFQKFDIERVIDTDSEDKLKAIQELNDLVMIGLKDLVEKKRRLNASL